MKITLEGLYGILTADGYSPIDLGDHLSVPVSAGEEADDGTWPDADEQMDAIRSILPAGWSAEWAGDGNTDGQGVSTFDVTVTEPRDRAAEILADLCDLDDGTGTIGIIIRQAISDDPSVTTETVREIVREAITDAATELARG